MINRKTIITVNAILAAAVLAVGYVYCDRGGLMIKAAASGLFALLGLVNFVYIRRIFSDTLAPNLRRCSGMMLAALFISMMADVIININFLFGALLFAFGHVFYFAAYCFIDKFRFSDFYRCFALVVISAAIIMLVPILDFGSVLMQGICLLYGFIISFMVGKALANFTSRSGVLTAVILIGSVMFYFSDLMLLFDRFTDAGQITAALCLGLYYPAQALLAVSVLFLGIKGG